MTRIAERPGAGAWLEIERAVEAFEVAYARLGPVEPADYCPAPGDPLRLPITAELVRVDLEFAARDGRSRRLEAYRTAFPDLFDNPDALAGVAFEEYRLRRQSGEPATPEEYQTRYGVDISSWQVRPLLDPSMEGSHDERALSGPDDIDENQAGRRFPEPGDEVCGFRLVRLLGRGAFGRVYLAEQADLARRYVALKLSTRFVAEAGTLARLQHTNIVPIYSVHQAGRFRAICMPFLGTVTLADVLQASHDWPARPVGGEALARLVADYAGPIAAPPLPASVPGTASAGPLGLIARMSYVEACLWIAAELADGLAHAHNRGVIHRDLKPANVLITDEGRPMILDFNLAGGDARGEFVGGTPSHMAPEQLAALLGEPARVDSRSDVYALGLILFELLTGQQPHPISSGQSGDQIKAILETRTAQPPSARRMNGAVTPAVDAILARALAPDLGQRYPSAQTLREDLLLQLDHRPLRHAAEPSIRERARKAIRRNPWIRSVPFVASLLAVVAAIGIGGFVYRTRQLDLARSAITLASFRQKADRARPLLTLPEPDDRDLATGLAIGRSALSEYGLGDLSGWNQDTAFRHLSPQQQMSLQEEIGELAFLLAGYEHRRADRADRPETGPAILQSALQLNRLAGELFQGDPARRSYVDIQRAQLLESAGQHGDAPAIRDAAPLQSGQGEGLWLRLSALDRRGEFRAALDLLKQNEPARGGSIGYWQSRGEHHAAADEWIEADAAFSTALALSPRPDADLLGRRGVARLNLGNFQAARDDHDAAIQLEPEDPALFRDRAQARLGLGDYTGAIADLDRAEALEPSHTRVYFMRSRILARAGDRLAAARQMEAGLALTPGDELSWIARGLARMGRDPEGAVADFDQALQLAPGSRQALQNKASVLSEQLGKTEEAISVLDRLIVRYPDYVPARSGRGVLLARVGRREAAHADAEAALDLSDDPFISYQVAGIFALTSRSHPADRDRGLRLLASAFRGGTGPDLVATDPDLEPIRDNPALRQLAEAARTLQEAASPPEANP